MATPTTTWTPIRWIDGEIMTELKLDSQQGDADYIRDLGRNRCALFGASTWMNEFDVGASQTEGVAQARLVLVDDSAHEVALAPVFLKGPGGSGGALETEWEKRDAKNIAWAASLGTNETLSLRWDWRANEAAGWSVAGTEPVVGVLSTAEAGAYLSVWAEIIVHARSRIMSLSTNWMRVEVRSFSMIAGRLNEVF